ncbi:MAG TPA: methyltransferase [Bryobacteraceae bacterium]|nr:methyltransferase [Bryobacteraceae bacterium]
MLAARSAVTVTPDGIMQTALGFMAAKTLLSAVELGLFTELAKGPRDGNTLAESLGLHSRASRDFLDALVATGLLHREDGVYSNSTEADAFLDKNKPTYIGGIIEMANTRLYPIWGKLTDGLRTGQPQSENAPEKTFADMYADAERMRHFLSAMTGLSVTTAQAIAARFPWNGYRTFCDIGCAQGAVPVHLALGNSHLTGAGFDLPVVEPVFREYVQSFGLQDRVHFTDGDFFKDPLPSADVLVMGHILHDWDLETKMMLLEKAWKALPKGGSLIVYEMMIDDERRTPPGLLMSLNMLLETQGGFDYTGADCTGWMKKTGFRDTRVEQLGQESMVVGVK